jgi:hypothetical protein
VKTYFAVFGAGVMVIALLGALGVGHAHFYYGVEPISCTKGKP